MTTRDEIAEWVRAGKDRGATHVMIIVDTFDWEDYPIYVKPDEDARAIAKNPGSMQRVMECYDLSKDIEAQLNENRSMNF